jgi:all-trans-retinol 13,14-reductase
MARYDAIVIGSGMGGLTVAAIMARLKGWRVLVLERHFRAGGFTHTFKRPGGWEWDVGLHYVGGMELGAMGRRLFDFVTAGGVRWNPMPDSYDRFVYPDFEFSAPKGEANYREALARMFPHEGAAIARYFHDLHAAMGYVSRHLMVPSMPGPLGAALRWFNEFGAKTALMTTGEYLDRHFRDPRLKALLASQWFDYGLPPAKSAFATHALIATHYLNGAWYPEGGAGTIAQAAGRVILGAGGAVLVSHEVHRILTEGDRAVGVEARHQQGQGGQGIRFDAPVVISNAGAWTTFKRLLPESAPVPFRRELDSAPDGFTVATLYLGLKRDPRVLGFQGENHWIFRSLDHDAMLAHQDDLLEGNAHGCYLSFPSLKDPRAKRHTAEIIAPLSYGALQQYRDEPWRRRSPGYQDLKAKITRALLDLVEQHHPGFGGLVEYKELSTPLTVEHFTAHRHGAIYGYPATPERYLKPWLTPATPVRNLYLTGADVGSLGVMGALMGGVSTAALLLGPLGFFRIVSAAFRERRPLALQVVPPKESVAEQPTA